MLLVFVPKVAIKIGHGGQSTVAKGNDVLDNCGAGLMVSTSRAILFGNDEPEDTLARARYKRWWSVGVGCKWQK
jgi:hypothetical protein